MTMSLPGATAATTIPPRERWLQALGVLVFVSLVGPAIGAVLFPTPLSGPYIWWTLLTHDQGSLGDRLSVLGYVVLGSYVLGMVPAVAAALVMAVATLLRGRFGYAVAAGAGVFGALAVWLTFAVSNSTANLQSGSAAMLAVFVPICVVAALICRWLLGVVRILPRKPLARA